MSGLLFTALSPNSTSTCFLQSISLRQQHYHPTRISSSSSHKSTLSMSATSKTTVDYLLVIPNRGPSSHDTLHTDSNTGASLSFLFQDKSRPGALDLGIVKTTLHSLTPNQGPRFLQYSTFGQQQTLYQHSASPRSCSGLQSRPSISVTLHSRPQGRQVRFMSPGQGKHGVHGREKSALFTFSDGVERIWHLGKASHRME